MILVINRSCDNTQHSKALLAELTAVEEQVVSVPEITRIGTILKQKGLQEQHDTGKTQTFFLWEPI